LARN
jgi:hypothetical protein